MSKNLNSSIYTDGCREFGSQKEEIEAANSAKARGTKGGVVALTHTSILEHFESLSHILGNNDPFCMIENNPVVCREILQKYAESYLQDDPRISVRYGDLFDRIFDMVPGSLYGSEYSVDSNGKRLRYFRKPVYAYMHMDFYCTAKLLTDTGAHANMRKLSMYWALKDTFHLDLTLSRWNCGPRLTASFVESVSSYFDDAGWYFEEPDKVNYFDSSPMCNYFWTFKRRLPREGGLQLDWAPTIEHYLHGMV